MGKGSAPRPFNVTQEEYDNRWALIFGKDKPAVANPVDETPVEEEDEEDDTCPDCGSQMLYRNVRTRQTDELTYVAGRMVCPECGYKGDLMEDVS